MRPFRIIGLILLVFLPLSCGRVYTVGDWPVSR
jgi:hypothetical protein